MPTRTRPSRPLSVMNPGRLFRRFAFARLPGRRCRRTGRPARHGHLVLVERRRTLRGQWSATERAGHLAHVGPRHGSDRRFPDRRRSGHRSGRSGRDVSDHPGDRCRRDRCDPTRPRGVAGRHRPGRDEPETTPGAPPVTPRRAVTVGAERSITTSRSGGHGSRQVDGWVIETTSNSSRLAPVATGCCGLASPLPSSSWVSRCWCWNA